MFSRGTRTGYSSALSVTRVIESSSVTAVRCCSTLTGSKPSPYKSVSVVGAPLRFGQPLPGTELGPTALRRAGLHALIADCGFTVNDLGDADVPDPQESDPKAAVGGKNTYAVGTGNHNLSQLTRKGAEANSFVLTLGGDHSAAMGSIAGILHVRPNIGVIWVDAHADLNDPSNSASGNVHGMPLSFLTRIIDPSSIPGCEWVSHAPILPFNKLVYVALRDVDKAEVAAIQANNIKAFTMHHIDKYGIGKVMEMALDHVGSDGCPLHLSYDIDAVDPIVAPSTGTTVPGGLNYREAHYVAEAIAETGQLGSMDLVEVNPTLRDSSGAAESTVAAGLELIGSALGQRIL